MSFKIIFKTTLLITLVFALLSGVIFLQIEASTSLPLRLKIPSIAVDSRIEHVLLTKDGAMDTPKNITNVAWYASSTIPGDIGTSVMAGHYGWKDGKKSAFDNLRSVKIGDVLYVEDSGGKTIRFIVYAIKTFDPKANTKEIFSSNDAVSHLNLITCYGSWNKTDKSYSERLIIFSRRSD